jgi:hypothetical protein
MTKEHIISGVKVVGAFMAGIWSTVGIYRVARYYDSDSPIVTGAIILSEIVIVSFIASRIMEQYTEGEQVELAGFTTIEEV